MRSRVHFILPAVIAMTFALPSSLRADEAAYTATVNELITWLPPKTTVLCVQRGSEERCDQNEAADWDPRFPCGVSGALGPIRKGKLLKHLAGKDITLAASALYCAGKRGPLSACQWSGAQILIFKNEIKKEAAELLRNTAIHADDSFQVGGHQVLRFNETIRREPRSFYVVFPSDRMLVVATNKGYLTNLLKRIDTEPKNTFLAGKKDIAAALPYRSAAWCVRIYNTKPPTIPLFGSRGFVCEFILKQDKISRIEISFFAGREFDGRDIAAIWKTPAPNPISPELISARKGVFKLRYNFQKLNDVKAQGAVFATVLLRLAG